jgi:hypothetical protein
MTKLKGGGYHEFPRRTQYRQPPPVGECATVCQTVAATESSELSQPASPLIEDAREREISLMSDYLQHRPLDQLTFTHKEDARFVFSDLAIGRHYRLHRDLSTPGGRDHIRIRRR